MRYALPRIAALACALTVAGLCQQSISVAKLVEFVKSSAAQKLPDKEVAAYLATVHINQRLTDQTVEDLLGSGAGPKTVAALKKLVDQSEKLAPAPLLPRQSRRRRDLRRRPSRSSRAF